jgi:hypothetical protein
MIGVIIGRRPPAIARRSVHVTYTCELDDGEIPLSCDRTERWAERWFGMIGEQRMSRPRERHG